MISGPKRTGDRLAVLETEAMPVIVRDVPVTYHWGWHSREDQRMHIQVVDRQHIHLGYKVWLESRGRRVFEPEANVPAKVVKALKSTVSEQRKRIEAEWVAFMIANRWLTVRLTGSSINLVAYPNNPNRFTRAIDLRAIIPNATVAQK